jgi:hypothetical protein
MIVRDAEFSHPVRDVVDHSSEGEYTDLHPDDLVCYGRVSLPRERSNVDEC